MGSPLSPIVANIFMEEFETSALQHATHQPKLWHRYVDDTFIIWQHSKQQLDNFFQHLNNQHSNIKFTMETEDQGSLPFLDHSHSLPCGHHQGNRRSSNTSSLQEADAYRQIPALQDLSQPHQPSQESPSPTWARHHTNSNVSCTVNIEVRYRSSNKLHSSLHTHKGQKHKNTQPGVYKIPCGKVYIGETGRSFNTRIKEHKACQRLGDGDKSAIVKHAQQQHKINWEDSSIITSIPHWHTKRVREAIEILQHNTIPQDSGFTTTTSGTLSCRKHIIKHCFTQVHNQLNIKSLHSRLQPIHKSSMIHTPVIQSFS